MITSSSLRSKIQHLNFFYKISKIFFQLNFFSTHIFESRFLFEKSLFSKDFLKKINLKFFFNFVILFSFLFSVMACKQKNNLSDTEKKELPPDFVTFYAKFHNDSIFQLAHIQFPLPGFPSQVDSIANNFQWTKETWRMHRTENFSDTLFTRTFEMPLPNCVNETVVLKNTPLGTFRRFYKRDNDWFLIFYADMNKIQ